MPLLPDILTKSASVSQPFILFQSSAAQSSLPILRDFIASKSDRTLLFSLLYPPSCLTTSNPSLDVYNLLDKVPKYSDDWSDPRKEILSALDAAPSSGPLDLIIDSADTLASDIGSLSQTYQFLRELLSKIRVRSDPSRLVLHLLSPSELITLLVQPTFSSALIHLTAYPPVLLTHLAKAYFVSPPPTSPPEKFWKVFLPFSERTYEIDRLVFGRGGEGCSRGATGASEFAVQILVRDGGDRSSKRRTLDRVLEAWSDACGGACQLGDLNSLKGVLRSDTAEAAPELSQNLTFNLALTSSQQRSRAQVPLPYAHEGKVPGNLAQNASAAIYYDPDSADDIDDDDPDDDLDL